LPEEIRRDARAAWLATRAGQAEAVPPPPQAERTLDLSGDFASARREARAQWLAQREHDSGASDSKAPEEQGREPHLPKLTLPNDDRAL
jgi:hypothetical protein